MVGLKDMAQSDAERAPPTWLRKLLAASFFDPCPEHPASEGRLNTRATDCNFFCTHCPDRALCSGCLGTHEGHELIQIRRSSGHNAVKVEDIEDLLSVSLVQTYMYNGDQIVFLNKRPMVGQGMRGALSHCEECNRGLQDEACRFCSLECKADGIEDRLDFSISFAVSAINVNATGENEANDETTEANDETTEADDVDEDEDPSYENEDEDSSSPAEV